MTDTPPPVPAYAALPAFAARAGRLTEGWRTLLGAFLFILMFDFLPPLFANLLLPLPLQDTFYDGITRTGVLMQFGSMLIPVLALRWLVLSLHGRGLWSLAGPPVETVALALRVSKVVFLALLAEQLLPPWPEFGTFTTVQPVLPWLLTVPLALIVVSIQVAGEELFFRGYLLQQLGARSRNPLVWMMLPSALFGAAHFFNADGPAEGMLWVLWALGLGMACADLTARTGSIGPAFGLHLINNLFALLLYGMENGPMSGLALFLIPYVDPASVDQHLGQLATPGGIFQILLTGLGVFVLWLAARLAIRR